MALTRTTTPALTTQVSSVGLISSIIGVVLRAFLTVRRSLLLLRAPAIGGLALRLDFSEGLLLVLHGDDAASSDMLPKATDSGTMRREDGSTRVDEGVFARGWPGFGRPRTAAAAESNVDRLARRASSWSGW